MRGGGGRDVSPVLVGVRWLVGRFRLGGLG